MNNKTEDTDEISACYYSGNQWGYKGKSRISHFSDNNLGKFKIFMRCAHALTCMCVTV